MPLFHRRGGHAEPEAETVERAPRADIGDRLREACPSSGATLANGVLAAVRFATRRVPEGAIDVGGCKFGCSPDLPAGAAWPTRTTPDGERRPLQFFAQVDLARAAQAAPGPLGLPANGLLSFFADFDGDGRGMDGRPAAGAVLYSSSDLPLARRSPRLEPLPSAELLPIGTWTWASAHVADGERAALEALRRSLDDDVQADVPDLWHGKARHQLGGHVDAAEDSRLLLQLDSDPSIEVAWGAGGMISWTARRADVEAAAWASAVFAFQPG